MPDIVIVHGLNNTTDSFQPLGDELEAAGFKVHYIQMQGHEELTTQLTVDSSVSSLHEQFLKLPEGEYYCIGFSQGGLVLQLALPNMPRTVTKQILLAPALKVHHEKFYTWLFKLVPSSFKLLMNTPKEVRKFNQIFAKYYEVLFNQISTLELSKVHPSHQIPTLMVIDPRDELVDSKGLESFVKRRNLSWNVLLFPRKIADLRLISKHHAIFHPQFHSSSDWKKFHKTLIEFLKK